MKKYLAFILLFFGIGCICSCTAIDELGDTSCVPEGMIRVEVPLSIASSVQTTEGVTREIEDRWEPIEDLEVQMWRRDMYSNYYTVNLDPSNLTPVTGENGQKQYILKFDIPEIILQSDDAFLDKTFLVGVRANLNYFSPYGSINPTPPASSPVYMSGEGEWRWDGETFVQDAPIRLYRSICKLRTLVRTVDKSVLGDWEVYPELTEVQLLDAPPYARKFHSVMTFLSNWNWDYVDPTVYVDYPSMVLRDFPSDQIVDIYLGEHTVDKELFRVYEQYFFENYLEDVSKYKAGVNITSLKVKIHLFNKETVENKIIERVIPINDFGYDWGNVSGHDCRLMRNTAYLLDIQVLSPEDIEANLHLQDWWAEETVDGDIPGVSFTVDKTEVPVIPYGVTDPAPAFEVVPDDPAFLDISLVDKDYKSVDQSNGFVLWYKLPKDGSLTKAPFDNRIRLHVNMGLRMFFTTVKNGNPGGFFRVTCGRSTRYIPIITPKYVRTDEIFNKTMTSNCYIAEKEGGYRFAGTVMGNGADGLPPTVRASMLPYNANGYLTGAAPSPVIAPKSAKLLWQDVDGLITQVGFDTNTTSHGDVVFNVSGAKGPGNAVISVYDTVDPNDPAARVLWSWHIWCAPRPEEMSTSGSAAVDDDGKRIYSFMDRNLGATTADGSDKGAKGLLYRFARNVPMIHFDKEQIFNILGTDITSLIAWGEGPDGGNRTGKYWDNILFPLHYYTHWNSNAVRGMWGDDFMLEEGPDGVDFDDKTIYDPCPAGYKVPTYMAFLALKELYHSNSKVREENSGIYFTGLRGGELCFPWVDRFFAINPSKDGEWLAISQGGMSDAGILKYYSASPYTDNNEDGFHGPGTSLVFSYGQGDMLTQEYYYEGVTSLLPVRCVREREKE